MRKLLVLAAILSAACSGSSGDNAGVTPTAATPTFSVPAGVKSAPISVTIGSATAGAVIHYTMNGVDPTAASTTTQPVVISTATTLKAIATATGYNASAVATAAYTFEAATPTFSIAGGTYTTAQNVALTTATPGATVYYTLDGTTPTTSSTAYAAPISLATDPSTTTIKAIAARAGFTDSGVASATYTIDSTATPAAAPTFTPGPGTYTSVQNVTIATTTAGATIYYTTDGSDPTASSTVYSTPVAVSSTQTLKAFATAPGHTASTIASALYTINLPQAATPTFSPAPGAVTSGQVVTIGSTTPGAVIHCTTNGTAATAASPVCTTVTVTAATTIRAVATATGYTTSAEATGSYTISGGTTCSGTDFASVCGCMQDKIVSLMTSCLKVNPALFTFPGPYAATPCSELQVEIDAGRVVYNATQGAVCAAAISSMTCAAVDPAFGVGSPTSCNAALVGQIATGGSCYSSEDCANGWCTSDMTATCPGTCQPYAAPGASCGNGTTECVSGTMCWWNGTGAFCMTPAGVGAQCPCQAGLWCDQNLATPVCKSPKTSGVCTYQDGECAVGYQCFAYDASGPHCLPISGSGGPCTANPCGWGYACSSGTCHAWATPGQSCIGASTDGQCAGGYCDGASNCVAYKAAGVACTSWEQCASGDCDGTGHCGRGYCAP